MDKKYIEFLKSEAKKSRDIHWSKWADMNDAMKEPIRKIFVDLVLANPNRTIKEIWKEGCEILETDWTVGYQSMIDMKRTEKFTGNYHCFSCSKPKLQTMYTKTSPYSIYGIHSWLNDWKEQPFSMDFLSPVYIRSLYKKLENKRRRENRETLKANTKKEPYVDISDEKEIVDEYRRVIMDNLAFVRNVWKRKMAMGRKGISLREAYWSAVLYKAYPDTLLSLVEDYSLIYATQEGYNEHYNADKSSWDTSVIDDNIMLFGGEESNHTKSLSNALAHDLGQVSEPVNVLVELVKEYPYEVQRYYAQRYVNDTLLHSWLRETSFFNKFEKEDIQKLIRLSNNDSILFMYAIRKVIDQNWYQKTVSLMDEPFGVTALPISYRPIDNAIYKRSLEKIYHIYMNEPSDDRTMRIVKELKMLDKINFKDSLERGILDEETK